MTEINNDTNQTPHKRRVRYSGTHPRSYKEKYKELNPEKYQADVAKIVQSGKTPAGTHIPIMVEEILEFLEDVREPLRQAVPDGETRRRLLASLAVACMEAGRPLTEAELGRRLADAERGEPV